MEPSDDSMLLRRFVENKSDGAFSALVARHINLVYSVAYRQIGQPQDAEEITQAVFIILAKKAASLRHERALTSWLFQTTRLTANNFIRSEMRRHRREQEAYMQSVPDESPNDFAPQLLPLLDGAVASLGERDRQAILLRLYEGRTIREVGATLGASEAAAEKRVSRALDKLRQYFLKRGVNSTTAAIGQMISAHSILTAPSALAKTATAAALAKGATVSTSTSTLIKGALKIMAWTKLKTAAVIGVAVILAGGTTTLVVTKIIAEPSVDESLWKADSASLRKAPPVLIIRPTKSQAITYGAGSGTSGSLIKLPANSVSSNDKAILLNTTVAGLLSAAYGIPVTRMILPAKMPESRYDLMLTLNDHPKEALQKEIKKRFGLTGRIETRDVDSLALKVRNSDAPGLKASAGGQSGSSFSSSSSSSFSGQLPPDIAVKMRAQGGGSGNHLTMNNQSISGLAKYLENRLGQKIVDSTELTGRFDITLQISPNSGETQQDALKRSVLEQLGFDLVPVSDPTEMLIVEKVK